MVAVCVEGAWRVEVGKGEGLSEGREYWGRIPGVHHPMIGFIRSLAGFHVPVDISVSCWPG